MGTHETIRLSISPNRRSRAPETGWWPVKKGRSLAAAPESEGVMSQRPSRRRHWSFEVISGKAPLEAAGGAAGTILPSRLSGKRR